MRRIARTFYGIEEITSDALLNLQGKAAEMRTAGKRMAVLQAAGIDHVQIDDFKWECPPDNFAPEYFLYDLSAVAFCNANFKPFQLAQATGVAVTDCDSLRDALAALFVQQDGRAIAVKSQHAYDRTLDWNERTDTETEPILAKKIADPAIDLPYGERLILGDWCMARICELCAMHNLPFKLHTGYYAGHSRMPMDRIRSGQLWRLLSRFPQTKFVLMHIAYPYSDELTALAKQYSNVWVDLCWAWSINPHAATDFVRGFIHSVPSNKLFGFGGDSFWPLASVAYSDQMRDGLIRALQSEIDANLLTEREAIMLAEQFMQHNQRACFDLEGTRRAIRATVAQFPTASPR